MRPYRLWKCRETKCLQSSWKLNKFDYSPAVLLPCGLLILYPAGGKRQKTFAAVPQSAARRSWSACVLEWDTALNQESVFSGTEPKNAVRLLSENTNVDGECCLNACARCAECTAFMQCVRSGTPIASTQFSPLFIFQRGGACLKQAPPYFFKLLLTASRFLIFYSPPI